MISERKLLDAMGEKYERKGFRFKFSEGKEFADTPELSGKMTIGPACTLSELFLQIEAFEAARIKPVPNTDNRRRQAIIALLIMFLGGFALGVLAGVLI